MPDNIVTVQVRMPESEKHDLQQTAALTAKQLGLKSLNLRQYIQIIHNSHKKTLDM